MIGVLAAAGSTNPTAIIGPTLVATFIGTIAAVVAAQSAAALLSTGANAPAEAQS